MANSFRTVKTFKNRLWYVASVCSSKKGNQKVIKHAWNEFLNWGGGALIVCLLKQREKAVLSPTLKVSPPPENILPRSHCNQEFPVPVWSKIRWVDRWHLIPSFLAETGWNTFFVQLQVKLIEWSALGTDWKVWSCGFCWTTLYLLAMVSFWVSWLGWAWRYTWFWSFLANWFQFWKVAVCYPGLLPTGYNKVPSYPPFYFTSMWLSRVSWQREGIPNNLGSPPPRTCMRQGQFL